MSLAIRVRHPAGASTLRFGASDTVADLMEAVAQAAGIPPQEQAFRVGFPPKPLEVVREEATLAEWGLSNGEALAVERLTSAGGGGGGAHAAAPAPNGAGRESSSAQAAPSRRPADSAQAGRLPADDRWARWRRRVAPPRYRGVPSLGSSLSSRDTRGRARRRVVRRVIVSDNSCLFNAVGYNLDRSRREGARLRRVVASAVERDPATFNDGFLEMSNGKYVNWILKPEKWGGPIELHILASCAALACTPLFLLLLPRYVQAQLACSSRRVGVARASAQALSVRDGRVRHPDRPLRHLWPGARLPAALLASLRRSPLRRTGRPGVSGCAGRGGLHVVRNQLDRAAGGASPPMSHGLPSADAGSLHGKRFGMVTSRGPCCGRVQIMDAAEALVRSLQQRKQFTDTNSFTLQCAVCYEGLVGAAEARAHAAATGHQNFQEYRA